MKSLQIKVNVPMKGQDALRRLAPLFGGGWNLSRDQRFSSGSARGRFHEPPIQPDPPSPTQTQPPWGGLRPPASPRRLSRITSCHNCILSYCILSYRIVSYRIVSCRVVSRRVASRRVASRRVASRRVASRRVASRRVASRRVESRRVASASRGVARRRVASDRFVSCRAMSCRAASCRVPSSPTVFQCVITYYYVTPRRSVSHAAAGRALGPPPFRSARGLFPESPPNSREKTRKADMYKHMYIFMYMHTCSIHMSHMSI